MDQIRPGLYHWTAIHPRIRERVSSYWFEPAGMLIDPMVPPERGVEPFRGREPALVVLTNRHHYRDSGVFAAELGCAVLCHKAGLHEFEGGPAVEGFAFGDRLAEGVEALEVGSICPEETALWLDADGGALAFADGLVRSGGELGFVSDRLLGDDPAAVKQGLLEAFARLAEREPESLLFAHGEPLVGDGADALREFVARARA
ncbi:MAG TPA: hypothetical protein VK919_00925 [Solirubrobacterales bacterium]|nr:hypothetical protein [Solirubrobacterales bacterium]